MKRPCTGQPSYDLKNKCKNFMSLGHDNGCHVVTNLKTQQATESKNDHCSKFSTLSNWKEEA